MRCPLKLITYTSYNVAEGVFGNCDKNNCAWYLGKKKGCSAPFLALSLADNGNLSQAMIKFLLIFATLYIGGHILIAFF